MGHQSKFSEKSESSEVQESKTVHHTVFIDGGEMGALMRSFDWVNHPLGHPEDWSYTLQTTTRLLLANSFPMLLWWGPDFLQLYNDAYTPVLGDKHPHAALGRPFRECWAEVFDVLGPLAQRPFEGGSPTLIEDIPLQVNRFGFVEETHFTIGYSAVPDPAAPGGIGGVLATVHEITARVLGDRRVLALRDLSTRSFEAKTVEEACKLAAETLSHYPYDIPFALIYLLNEKGSTAHLVCSTGLEGFSALGPQTLTLTGERDQIWPLAAAREQQGIVLTADLPSRFSRVPPGPWPDPPDSAITIPINSNVAGQPLGFLVAGVSSRLRLDDAYRGFFELLSTQIATAVLNARAYEEERKRSQALAELDRANVSGQGSIFTVSIPTGTAHLPKEHLGTSQVSSATHADAFLREAESWLPTATDLAERSSPPVQGKSDGPRAKILLADDNADMREYLERLLGEEYDVSAVPDGNIAFQTVLRHAPDLVITDVMMPRLDGFGLLRAMRADPRTAATPIILLSARAGEEARVEGVAAGADDYLVKPFSARELLVRVENQLNLARLRRESEGLIRANEERFRALVTATSYSLYRMSPDWQEMRQLTGRGFLPDADAPRRNWLREYILPEDRSMVLNAIDKAIREKSIFELEHRVRNADGSIGWTYSRAVPMLDPQGNIEEWFGATSDVTDRKRFEESQIRLAAIVDSADDAIVSKDLNGIVNSWNQGATRMFGYTSEEMVGRSIRTLIPRDMYHEEDEILRKLRAGERIDHYETTRLRKDGTSIEVSITISPIRDASGNVIGASKIARDISDRKRVESLLLQNEKLGATGKMAASIAHEINNPLESLVNLIYLARQYTAPDTKAYQCLLTAEEELDRVSHIARQTLGFYRDTASQTEVSLHELIQNVLTVYNSRLLASDIATDLRFNDVEKVIASKGELLQVFSNIIANAIDSMPHGGSLYISTQKVARAGREGIEVVIRDSGVGIRSEHLPRIFEPFFTTKGDRGTGIGLWVARQLVEARGGLISATSNAEKGKTGTAMTIFIPLAVPPRTNGAGKSN